MPRKPDYKREKKQREEAQRKRNQEAQQKKATRKAPAENPTDATETTPDTP